MKIVGVGREAEIIEWDGTHVVRLMRDPSAGERLGREPAALAAAHAGGAPVPEIGDLVTVDGRPGLIMERIDGPDLIAKVAKRPWTIFDAAASLGSIHAAIHRIAGPAGLRSIHEIMPERIEAAGLPPRLSSAALQQLETLPAGDRLCHGDLHPGNVLVSSRGSLAIDWTNASRGPADADVARTVLMLELAVVPDTMPAIVRGMSAIGRRIFLRGYVRRYRKERPYDDDVVRRWQIVQAAARVVEGIVEEEPLLLAYLERTVAGA